VIGRLHGCWNWVPWLAVKHCPRQPKATNKDEKGYGSDNHTNGDFLQQQTNIRKLHLRTPTTVKIPSRDEVSANKAEFVPHETALAVSSTQETVQKLIFAAS